MTIFIRTSLAAALICASAAIAHARTITYQTYISVDDLHNSSGVRLGSAAAIVQQDRAHVHKFGLRDPGDQHDSYFNTPARRSALRRALRGRIPSDLARAIKRGGVAIIVRAEVSGGAVYDAWVDWAE
ncbi:MAG: hypothetical protein MRY74_14290 [Neomegalonema sp.]|nr:hypothetical protein [Neomegalonema sp.]